MSDTDIEDVLKLDCEERYDFFLSLVSDDREIWILVSEDKQFLKIHTEEDDNEFLPVWPTSEFAQHYAKDLQEQLTPKSIAVPEFFSKWVPGLEGDDIKVGVIPSSGSDVWVTEASELKADLQDAFSNFDF